MPQRRLAIPWSATVLGGCGLASIPVTSPPLDAHAPPSSSISSETNVYRFDVHGLSPDAIRADLNRARAAALPTQDGGPPAHDAWTQWDLQWRWTSDLTAAGCVITTAHVEVTIGHWIPHLVSTEVPSETQAAWDTYMAALWRHERGHAEIAFETANQIVDELMAERGHATCADLDGAAGARARSLLASAKKREVTFDLDTRHGVSEGAQFP